MKKQELYVMCIGGERERIRVKFPISFTNDDIEDVLSQQSTKYVKLDGEADGYIPVIYIQQRQKWQ